MARSNAIGKMRAIAEDVTDPKQVLLKALGKHNTEVFHSQVLVAGYVRPAKTKGGVWLSDKAIEEDRYQGNVGLVIGMGGGAFKDDNISKFHGQSIEVGDWVMYVPGDGIPLFINEVPCRIFSDSRIMLKVKDPEIYY